MIPSPDSPGVIGLERPDIEGSRPLCGDRLGYRKDAREGRIMRHLLEESGLADRL